MSDPSQDSALLATINGSSNWNKDGFSLIHRAVIQNNNHRIQKLLSISPSAIETKTTDKLKLTPLLVAAKYGCTDTFHFLLKMGAKAQAKSSRGLNAVQWALIHKQSKLVCSLLDHPQFTVFEDVFELLTADTSVKDLVNCLRVFSDIIASYITHLKEDESGKKYEARIISLGGISKLKELIEACLNQREMLDQAATIIVKIMESMCFSEALLQAMVENSMGECQVKLMDTIDSVDGILGMTTVTAMMAKSGAGKAMMSLHAPRVCLNAGKRAKCEKTMLTIIACMQQCAADEEMVKNFHADGILDEFVTMLEDPETSPALQCVVIQNLTKVASINEFFRLEILKLGAVHTILKLKMKSDIIVEIVDFLCAMCAQRGDTEAIVKKSTSTISKLLYIIKNSLNSKHQHKAFEILWLIAGSDIPERRALASIVGPGDLIKMLSTASAGHRLAAMTALHLLSPVLYGLQDEIVNSGAIGLLLMVIRSTTDGVVKLEALQTLENCSHDVALRPNKVMQQIFLKEGGIPLLLKLQANAQDVETSLQTKCTLAATSIRNSNIKKMILKNPLFSLEELINKLSPENDTENLILTVRTISYLAYNSIETQNAMLNIAPLPFEPFKCLMSSTSTKISTEAAFHIIVLVNILSNIEDNAALVADCIRHLVKALGLASIKENDEQQIHICELLCALFHMRSGIIQALIAGDITWLLVQVMFTSYDNCRRAAAIALSSITRDREGCRILLGYCRKYEKLFGRIVENCKGYDLSLDFIEGWQHYKSVNSLASRRRKRESLTSPSVKPSVLKGATLFSE